MAQFSEGIFNLYKSINASSTTNVTDLVLSSARFDPEPAPAFLLARSPEFLMLFNHGLRDE